MRENISSPCNVAGKSYMSIYRSLPNVAKKKIVGFSHIHLSHTLTTLTDDNDRLHLLDILMVKFVEEEEEQSDYDESDSKADNEEN